MDHLLGTCHIVHLSGLGNKPLSGPKRGSRTFDFVVVNRQCTLSFPPLFFLLRARTKPSGHSAAQFHWFPSVNGNMRLIQRQTSGVQITRGQKQAPKNTEMSSALHVACSGGHLAGNSLNYRFKVNSGHHPGTPASADVTDHVT